MDTTSIPDSLNTHIQVIHIRSWNHEVLHKGNFLKGNHQITDLSQIKEALVQPIDNEGEIKHQLILKVEKVHRFSAKFDPWCV